MSRSLSTRYPLRFSLGSRPSDLPGDPDRDPFLVIATGSTLVDLGSLGAASFEQVGAMDTAGATQYRPATFLAEPDGGEASTATTTTTVLIILNQPIAHFKTFARLWQRSHYRVCADGGANRLFDLFRGQRGGQREDYLPDDIHGDLDSLRHDVRRYYDTHGVEISQDGDQYSTDFAKCLHKTLRKTFSSPLAHVLILGSLGGRVDQGLGLLHEMLREQARQPSLSLWLFAESSLSFVLPSGRGLIAGLETSQVFTQNAGLIPVYGPAVITTVGLEWDVKEWPTQMGGQVSTSNHVKADQIQVISNAPILFTVEIRLPDEHMHI